MDTRLRTRINPPSPDSDGSTSVDGAPQLGDRYPRKIRENNDAQFRIRGCHAAIHRL